MQRSQPFCNDPTNRDEMDFRNLTFANKTSKGFRFHSIPTSLIMLLLFSYSALLVACNAVTMVYMGAFVPDYELTEVVSHIVGVPYLFVVLPSNNPITILTHVVKLELLMGLMDELMTRILSPFPLGSLAYR